MSSEQPGITREEFANLPDSFFDNIDKRLTWGYRTPFTVGRNGDTIGYRLGFDHGENSYTLRFDLTRKHNTEAEVLTIWHQVTKKSDNRREFDRNSRALIQWWNSSHPDNVFGIYVDEDERKILVGRRFPVSQFRPVAFRTLISRLIDVIPEVEARVEQGF